MKTLRWIAIGCLGGMMLTGCTAPLSRVETHFGVSYHLARVNQIRHPEAGNTLAPVSGFDGKAAQNTVEKYRKSFTKPPAPHFILSVREIK
jgi:hypothetical protein